LGPAVKEEEIRSSLSPVGKSFSQALSPSLSLCLSLDSTVKEEKKKRKRKRKKRKRRNIFGF
jgi:hypothetical protein